MIRQILLAGDSTVTNRGFSDDYESGICYTGWGEMLSMHLGLDYRVKNFAKSGLTTDTFREKGHYELLLGSLNEGDYVLFQFGHNDEKVKELQASGRYKENLIVYINEIREKNAEPILVTSLARNSWKCGTNEYNDLLEEYADVVRNLAIEKNVKLIDLHKFSKEWIIKEGREAVKPYFYPGDFTHTNDYGAFFFAEFVAKSLRQFIKPKNEKIDVAGFCPSKIPSLLLENSESVVSKIEALRIAREYCAFFAKNDMQRENENSEILCARHNGYLLFEDRLDENISEKEFVQLFKLAVSSRELVPEDFVSTHKREKLTRREVLEYLKDFENKVGYSKNRKKAEIAGS